MREFGALLEQLSSMAWERIVRASVEAGFGRRKRVESWSAHSVVVASLMVVLCVSLSTWCRIALNSTRE